MRGSFRCFCSIFALFNLRDPEHQHRGRHVYLELRDLLRGGSFGRRSAGWLRFGRDIDAELSSTNPTVRARAREAQEYMLHVGQFKLRELSGKDARGNDSIVSDGSGDLSIQAHPNMGNETMFINDAIGLRDENERVNTTFVQVIHDGWPYIFVVSTRNIAANDELLISYGEVFWQTTKEKKGGAGRWLRFIAFVFVAIGSPVLIAIGLLMITGRLPNGRSNGR